jgi:serine/threonine-protein kinase PpkA
MEIPGYTIKRVIGEGGMSTVYLAVQQSLEREVALKIMSDRLVSDESFRKRFLKEGKIIAQLHHPRIVTIHDFGFSGDIYYICQEYLPGGTLADEIQHGIEIPRALFVVKGIADALDYAHSRGFVHRDIKPQNILFRNDRLRSPVLTDFGIAKAITPEDTKLTIVNAFCGSPAYASPEQAKGLELDGRSDIYSLGILIFQMLSGHVPYDAKDPVS